MNQKVFSAAAERNKQPILERLCELLRDRHSVLEIGSGSGQHALYFADNMPWLNWTCSELPAAVPALDAGLADRPNLVGPITLDVQADWPDAAFDALFTANTLHIMPWSAVTSLFQHAGMQLPVGGRMIVYGPFHFGGKPTSESNAAFDTALREGDPKRGVRNIEAVDALASGTSLQLLADFAMPANNRLLAWEKV